ncbi:MAG: carboxymuconolactone decarboxylase family protein [SAR202 cluster bacterium]|jgi:4-carboxymuconolactone decarboxylase|nr:MAG: carboxymuconolactone decarboxylase family protein [SAR202 cluster bacterium]MQG80779.1 carboxymuconolactone decarboxylase family protein [SAR202 cluster bacterium]|tara:strand:+ start:488 stop:868 length:381 start_codon:yes stop_codon:yes gene_type:complete
MSTQQGKDFLDETAQNRGYTLEMHKIMAIADIEWAQKYNAFIAATYTGQRTLDRKTKELLQIVVEAALRADVEQIQAHVRVALQEGATPQEILESLQAVIAPMGALAFRRGLQAWAAETGFEIPED